MNQILIIEVYTFLMNWRAKIVNNFVKNDSLKQTKK